MLIIVFISMKYEYDRLEMEFGKTNELLEEIDKYGADGWEIISYDEKKPKKFGGKTKCVVLFKKRCDE
jgi:hypothetical protein